jgi:predicted aspartyl protease
MLSRTRRGFGSGPVKLAFARTPIVVPCTIHGAAGTSVANLLLDTGASVTVISPKLLALLGYDIAASPHQLELTTADSTLYVKTIKLSKISIGTISVEDMLVAAHSLPPASDGGRPPRNGLLRTTVPHDRLWANDSRDCVAKFQSRWADSEGAPTSFRPTNPFLVH